MAILPPSSITTSEEPLLNLPRGFGLRNGGANGGGFSSSGLDQLSDPSSPGLSSRPSSTTTILSMTSLNTSNSFRTSSPPSPSGLSSEKNSAESTPRGESFAMKTEECIKDVWAHNLDEEMRAISALVEDFPCIGMDTEFPGVVYVAEGHAHCYRQLPPEVYWRSIFENVNMLKIIQLGLTFSDSSGNLPEGTCTWQFHFKFDLKKDKYAESSIELLRSSGLDFERHNNQGIDVDDFAVQLTTSGLVLQRGPRWISFHSGYDFGYLLRLLTGEPLPKSEEHFMALVDTFFGNVYDIKRVAKFGEALNWKTGLAGMACDLRVQRIGPCHQAGSDSLITSAAFFAMVRGHFTKFDFEDARFKNVLFGLGSRDVD